MEPVEPKLCIECGWSFEDTWDNAACTCPANIQETPERVYGITICGLNRCSPERCGSEGRHWKPKETLWATIKRKLWGCSK